MRNSRNVSVNAAGSSAGLIPHLTSHAADEAGNGMRYDDDALQHDNDNASQHFACDAGDVAVHLLRDDAPQWPQLPISGARKVLRLRWRYAFVSSFAPRINEYDTQYERCLNGSPHPTNARWRVCAYAD
ncbi:MAG TPA: hypothetical protein VKB76_16570 [Ktedonobacterales bacterium]|nr:hypothetical protein [Ktedonobacterales bacterium]